MSIIDKIRDIKRELSNVSRRETVREVRENPFERTRKEETRDTEIHDPVEIKNIILEAIVLEETAEDASVLKKFYNHVKSFMSKNSGTKHMYKHIKRGGYSEYTCWDETVSTEGEIPHIDMYELNREIDDFIAELNQK